MATAPEPKVFCLGFNKTGTTSMGRAFEMLGLGPLAEPQVLHERYGERYGEWPYRAICDAVFDGDFAPALEIAREFRCFKDRPWNVAPMYRALDEAFPGSRFILTVRDPEQWWLSVERYVLHTRGDDSAMYARFLRHTGCERFDRACFLAAYERHNAELRSYFAGRDDFLEFRSGADGWPALCEFLGLPAPDGAFPHFNRQTYG